MRAVLRRGQDDQGVRGMGGGMPRSREHAEAHNEVLAGVEKLHEQEEEDQDAQEDRRKQAWTSSLVTPTTMSSHVQ